MFVMKDCHICHGINSSLPGQREALHLAQAQAGVISVKETAAASAMACMNQNSQDGLDVIPQASAVVVWYEKGLEELQRMNLTAQSAKRCSNKPRGRKSRS